MSNNDWVQEGTPRESEWTAEADEYGVPLEPAEWDDYSAEQGVPVPTPPSSSFDELPGEVSPPPTAPEPDDIVAGAHHPVAADGAAPVGEYDDESPVAPDDEVDPVVIHEDDPALAHSSADDEALTGDHDDDASPWSASPWSAENAPLDPSLDEVRIEEIEDAVPLFGDHREAHADVPVDDQPPAEYRDGDVDAPVALDDAHDDAVDGPDAEYDPVVDAGEPVLTEQVQVSDPEAYPAVDAHTEDDATTVRAAVPVEDGPGATPLTAATDTTAVGTGAGPAAAGAGTAAGVAAGAATMAGLYRGDRDSQDTQIMDARQSLADEQAEEERFAHQLRMEKEARDQRLGLVATSDANAVRETAVPRRRVGGFGSFGLLVLRLVTGAILGVVAYQILGDVDRTAEFLGQTLIPEPRLVSWILGFALGAMAVFLVIGLAVRVVGLLLALIAGAALGFVRWGQFSPFVEGMEGFIGDKDLLMAAVGIVFFTLGGGRAGIDGAISTARYNARESRSI